jgi:hypothetical protein
MQLLKVDGGVVAPVRTLPIFAEVDVLVAGGGSAGWYAAVAAARNGAKTLLIERHGSLGGTVTNAMVQPFMNFHSPLGEAVVGGVWQEMLDSMKFLHGTSGPLPAGRGKAPWGKNPTLTPFDPEVLRFVAQELVLGAGAELLLHTMIVDTVMEGDELRGVVIENKSGRQVVLAKCVVDATGDADIAAFAGAPFMFGREEDNLTMPMSLYIKMRNIDYKAMGDYVLAHPEEFRWWSFPDVDPSLPPEMERAPVSCSGFLSIVRAGRESGSLLLGRETINVLPCPRKGEAVLNCTRIGRLDPTNAADLTTAEVEARRQAMSVISWAPGNLPGFQDAELVSIAPCIGVRESRRIIGEYVLQLDDVLKGRKFDDAIARSAYNVDIHNPHNDKSTWYEIEDAYDIPYRCLLPKKIENLLVAGRCISTTHEASGSARMTPHVAATGEAAGTAAALAVKAGVNPRAVNFGALRRQLLSQNVNLGSNQSVRNLETVS